MYNTTKKILASACALGLLASGAVFAAEEPVVTDGVTATPITTEEPAAPVQNGGTVYAVEAQEINGQVAVPLRSVAEALGYTVEWQDADRSITLTKGARFVIFSIDTDSYAFSRMAPVQLGLAPTLVNDETTYVPITFFSEILGGYYEQNEDGTYKIVEPSVVTVTNIAEDGTLTVTDSYLGEVIVHISDETKITINGEAATKADIQKDDVLGVEYSPVMTASIPPQTTAVAIQIQNRPVEGENETGADNALEDVAFSGTITEVGEDGTHVLIQTDGDNNNPEIMLILSDETVITRGNDKRVYKADDLEAGMKISGTHSPAMTMSIPPQTAAVTIQIESDAADTSEEETALENVAFSGTITEINEAGHVIVNTENGEIALLVTDDTQITKGNDKRIYKADDLEAGMEISGEHSAVMTRSIPPQTAAITIQIASSAA